MIPCQEGEEKGGNRIRKWLLGRCCFQEKMKRECRKINEAIEKETVSEFDLIQ